MISAFKHIRLSGLNLTPVEKQNIYGYGLGTRLGLGGSGLAYQSELLSVSGDLQQQINNASADVSSIYIETGNGLGYTLQNALTFTGANGITLGVNGQVITFSGDTANLSNAIFQTGKNLSEYNTVYSGWASAEFVKKATQQVFSTPLTPTNLDAYAIIYPAPFDLSSTPKVQATLEVPGDVMYNLSIQAISYSGYTGLFSDNVMEAGAKIHTFVSV